MIGAWWDSLNTALQVYFGIAIVTSVLLGLQLALAMLGFDHDADVDLGDGAHDSGMGVLSLRSVSAFFTGFGWGGVIALRQGLGLFAATAVALLAGGLLMAAVVGLMRALYGLRESGTLDYANAVGVLGNVYLPIPPQMEGPGQVEVLVQGRLCVVSAFTRAGFRIPNRARVRVVEALDPQTLLVEPLDPPAGASAALSSHPASSTTSPSQEA